MPSLSLDAAGGKDGNIEDRERLEEGGGGRRCEWGLSAGGGRGVTGLEGEEWGGHGGEGEERLGE